MCLVGISPSAVSSVDSAMLPALERIREGRLMRSSMGSMRWVIVVSLRWILGSVSQVFAEWKTGELALDEQRREMGSEVLMKP